MPEYPDNIYRCVCGDDFNSFGLLQRHRAECDSWSEHVTALKADGASAAETLRDASAPRAQERAQQPTQEGFACPIEGCKATRNTWSQMKAHVDHCGFKRDDVHVTSVEVAEIDVDLNIVLSQAARRHEDAEAFRRWCEENGRP